MYLQCMIRYVLVCVGAIQCECKKAAQSFKRRIFFDKDSVVNCESYLPHVTDMGESSIIECCSNLRSYRSYGHPTTRVNIHCNFSLQTKCIIRTH